MCKQMSGRGWDWDKTRLVPRKRVSARASARDSARTRASARDVPRSIGLVMTVG